MVAHPPMPGVSIESEKAGSPRTDDVIAVRAQFNAHNLWMVGKSVIENLRCHLVVFSDVEV